MFRFTLGAVLALALIQPILAAAEDEAAVVVTATRSQSRPEDAPGPVDVVGRREIRARNPQNIGDSVNALPGVWVRPGRGALDVQQTIVLHGIPDEKRNLVLVDGLPLNDAYSGGLNLGGLPAELLQRVEVVQGAASALYGGNAMGGVVQFVTRMPTKTEYEFKLGYGDPFRAGTASENTSKVYASAGTRLEGGTSLLAAISARNTAGYASEQTVVTTKPTAGISGWSTTQSPTGAVNYLIGDKGDNRWADQSLHLKAQQTFGKDATLRLAYTRNTFDYRFGLPHSLLRNAAGSTVYSYGAGATAVAETNFIAPYGGLRRDTWQAVLSLGAFGGDLKLNLGYIDTPDNYFVNALTTPAPGATRFGGPGRLTNVESSSRIVDLQWSGRIHPQHRLTLGTAWRGDDAANRVTNLGAWNSTASTTTLSSETSGKTATLGLFVQDEIALAERWTAFLGLRADRWRTTDGYINNVGTAGFPQTYQERTAASTNPKVAMVWRASDRLAVKGSVGRAFRPPTVFELYRTSTVGTITRRGNPDLKPETVTSADLGVDVQPWSGGSIKLNRFANRLRDLVYASGSGAIRDRINVGLASSLGWTLGVEQTRGNWRLFANSTWTNAKIRDNTLQPSTVGKDMTQLPSRMANVGVDLRAGDWTWTAAARHAGKQYSNDDNTDNVSGVYGSYDAYTVAETKLAWRFSKQATVSLAIDNLFDKSYYSFYLAPRRSWLAEIALAF